VVERLRALSEKWRDESDGVEAMGYSQQADRMRDCADELVEVIRALASRDAQGETPPQGPEDAGVRAYQSEPTMSAPPSTP
jgi:hypothetical protein